MKFITVEEHITSSETLIDIEKERLPYMDKTGITMQVLSCMNSIMGCRCSS